VTLGTIQPFSRPLNGYWLHLNWIEIGKTVKLNTRLYLVSWLRISGVIFALPQRIHHGVHRDLLFCISYWKYQNRNMLRSYSTVFLQVRNFDCSLCVIWRNCKNSIPHFVIQTVKYKEDLFDINSHFYSV
jgi:hypothetical protein